MTTHALTDDTDTEEASLEAMIAQLLAEALTRGLHLLRGRFFDLDARSLGDGRLIVDIRQLNFLGEDPRLAGVLLQVTVPAAEQTQDHEELEASAT